ncbi:MAG: twin-arginine translocase TatA/TatE family subunit [Sulfurimonas sp.]
MSMPSGMELLLIFGIVVLLFGAKKIPDLAKGLGQGIKNFKKEMKNDDETETKVASSEAPKKVEADKESSSKEAPKTTEQA